MIHARNLSRLVAPARSHTTTCSLRALGTVDMTASGDRDSITSPTTSSSSRALQAAADHSAAVLHYKSDTQTLANWLDVSIVSRKGRAYAADRDVLDPDCMEAITFPFLQVTTLNGEDVTLPDALVTVEEGEDGGTVSSGVKVVCFSFKQYGFGLVRTWLDPFWERYGRGVSASVPSLEICFVEHGFLSFARSIFTANIKEKVPEDNHSLTMLSFGNVADFSAHLLLPNKFTGYVVVLDKDNKVRWRGCGTAEQGELDVMFDCIERLKGEQVGHCE